MKKTLINFANLVIADGKKHDYNFDMIIGDHFISFTDTHGNNNTAVLHDQSIKLSCLGEITTYTWDQWEKIWG